MSENNNGSSIWDNFSCHFPLCNLDGKEQKKKYSLSNERFSELQLYCYCDVLQF